MGSDVVREGCHLRCPIESSTLHHGRKSQITAQSQSSRVSLLSDLRRAERLSVPRLNSSLCGRGVDWKARMEGSGR